MAIISGRLRERARDLYGKTRYRNDFDEAAEAIDALVAALEAIKREAMRCRGDQSYRDAAKFAVKESSAALALARKVGP